MREPGAKRASAVARGGAALAAAALAALPAVAGGAPPAASAPARPASSALVLLDGSSAMRAPDREGEPKAEAARVALRSLPVSVPSGSPVGIRVYGGSCGSSRLVSPVAPLTRAAIANAAGGYSASGKAPLALALQRAVKDLPAAGPHTILVVAGAGDDCVRAGSEAACQAAGRLAARDDRLRIETAGVAVSAAARRELSCVAKAGRGVFRDALGGTDLTRALDAAASRALRDRRSPGAPAAGAATKAEAPSVSLGPHADTIAPGEERWYAVHPRAGAGPLMAATLVAPEDAGSLDGTGASLTLQIFRATGVPEPGDAYSSVPSLFSFGSPLPTAGVHGLPLPVTGVRFVKAALEDQSGSLASQLRGRALRMELWNGVTQAEAEPAPKTVSGATASSRASGGAAVAVIAGALLAGALTGFLVLSRRPA